jgi:protein CpxP
MTFQLLFIKLIILYTMNKYKFLTIIVIVLLIINGILFFILVKNHKRKGGPKNIIIEKLHFDKKQIKKYEVFIQQHRNAINENENSMNKLRSKLYEELKNADNSIKIDSLITIIGKQQMDAEYINYKHFLEIKKLCKPNQKKDFDELIKEIANLFSSKGRK